MNEEENKAAIEGAAAAGETLKRFKQTTALCSAALTLIERNRWGVSPQIGGGWVIETSEPTPGGDDADVIELARTRGSLVDAVVMAAKRCRIRPFEWIDLNASAGSATDDA